MKRWSVSLLLLVLVGSLPAFAGGESCQLQETLSRLRVENDVLIDDQAYQADPQLLLYRLPTEIAEGAVLEVRFERRESTIFAEEIALLADSKEDSPSAVIELLSIAPAERARIHQLPPGSIAVQVRLDRTVLQTLSLAELIEGSDALKEEGVLPRAIQPAPAATSADSGFQSLSAPLTACEEACWDDFYFCTGNCSFPNGPTCYPACDSALISCLAICNPSCAPKVKTKSTVTLLSTVQVGPVECKNRINFGVDRYIRAQQFFKQTITTTTTHADCSQTVEVAVHYFDSFCWAFYSPNCSFPSGTIGSFC